MTYKNFVITKENADCCGCGACVNVCPKKCIVMQEDNNGFRYPKIDDKICIKCGLCEKICPINNYKSSKTFDSITFACQNLNIDERMCSSSGGMFVLFAKYILSQNGIVYGATFEDNLVKHISVDSVNDLSKLLGSKYLQSNITDCYTEIESFLRTNKLVLFSGTGCQIAGLRSYLGKDYDNLFLIEIVCHGVPSEKIFRKYIKELENKENSKIVNINFRNKVKGWKNYEVTVYFENGTILSEDASKNSFMLGFIHNLYLRPSCLTCKFKKMNSGSDILLGDFWGVDELGFPWNDNKGSSVVVLNTEKAKTIFDHISNLIHSQKVDLSLAVRFNPCICESSKSNISENIYEEYEKYSLKEVNEKYISLNSNTQKSFFCEVLKRVKMIMKG